MLQGLYVNHWVYETYHTVKTILGDKILVIFNSGKTTSQGRRVEIVITRFFGYSSNLIQGGNLDGLFWGFFSTRGELVVAISLQSFNQTCHPYIRLQVSNLKNKWKLFEKYQSLQCQQIETFSNVKNAKITLTDYPRQNTREMCKFIMILD